MYITLYLFTPTQLYWPQQLMQEVYPRNICFPQSTSTRWTGAVVYSPTIVIQKMCFHGSEVV